MLAYRAGNSTVGRKGTMGEAFMMTHSFTEEKLGGTYRARIREYADGNDTVLDLCREEVWVGTARGGGGLLHSVGAPFFVDSDEDGGFAAVIDRCDTIAVYDDDDNDSDDSGDDYVGYHFQRSRRRREPFPLLLLCAAGRHHRQE